MGKFIRSISSLIGGSSGAAAPDLSEATPLPSAQPKADEPQAPQSQQQALPLVPYAVRAESMPHSTPQRSRSVSLLRRTHPANATTHAMPTLHPHPTGPVLTQTERVRLQVMQAQIQLTSLRLYDGPIDGMMTLATATAVRYFQTLKGQRPSGVLTAGTLAALGIAPTP